MSPLSDGWQQAGLQGHCIVSMALEDWHSTWRSRHHLLSRLAVDNDVLYCTPPIFSHDVRDCWRRRAELPPGVEPILPRLLAYRPPYWIPQVFRPAWLRQGQRRRLVRHLRGVLRARSWKPSLLYVWHPAFAELADEFPECPLVYHVYDEYASFETDPARQRAVLESERRLLERAVMVFTASETLKSRRLAHNPNIRVISNGVDYTLFARAADPGLPVPADAAALKGPVIGYVTTQTTITDLPLLREVFSRRPDWTFLFVGLHPDELARPSPALAALKALPNVHLIGPRKLQEMPGYLKRCDVLAIPWLVNEISLSGSPLKLYEYLAAGKPVVSTPLTHLRHLEPVIAFADGAEAWSDAIDQALNGRAPGTVATRQALARDNTWDAKARELSLCLQSALGGGRLPAAN